MNEEQRQAVADAPNVVLRDLEDAQESVERNKRTLERSEARVELLKIKRDALLEDVDW